MSENKMDRRSFLGTSAKIGVVGMVGGGALLASCAKKDKGPVYIPLRQPDEYYIPELPDKAIDGKPLKAGVIGCGGRGSGAIMNLLDAADGITVTALGDTFADRLNSLKDKLKEQRNQVVPDENCFVGFDAYKKVIDSGVDMVVVATPPVFRPTHFQYATEKGVHSFLEKPIAVDAKGYRLIMATAKQAQAKGLSVVCGTQRHHQRPYVEAFKKIQEGMIGEITGGNVYWNQGMLWYKERQKGWSDMEWMIRDWVNWKWLSGDHIVEQHVHNIDVFNWMFGYKHPIKATAFGSRQRRITGDQYDFFSVDFDADTNTISIKAGDETFKVTIPDSAASFVFEPQAIVDGEHAMVIKSFTASIYTPNKLDSKDENVVKSANNVPTVKTAFVNTINVYDILKYDSLVLTQDAVAAITEVYA